MSVCFWTYIIYVVQLLHVATISGLRPIDIVQGLPPLTSAHMFYARGQSWIGVWRERCGDVPWPTVYEIYVCVCTFKVWLFITPELCRLAFRCTYQDLSIENQLLWAWCWWWRRAPDPAQRSLHPLQSVAEIRKIVVLAATMSHKDGGLYEISSCFEMVF